MRIVNVLTGESHEWEGLSRPVPEKKVKPKFKHRTTHCPVVDCNLCALLEEARRRNANSSG